VLSDLVEVHDFSFLCDVGKLAMSLPGSLYHSTVNSVHSRLLIENLTLSLHTTSSPSRMHPFFKGHEGWPNCNDSRIALETVNEYAICADQEEHLLVQARSVSGTVLPTLGEDLNAVPAFAEVNMNLTVLAVDLAFTAHPTVAHV